MKNYPKIYYATETKLLHKVGYTLALALMAVGVAETAHSIPYIVRGESNLLGITLGPSIVVLSGLIAGGYLMEAGVISDY